MNQLSLITYLFVLSVIRIRACPSACSCSGLLTDCSGRNLTSIPDGISLFTENLRLDRNRINTLDHSYIQTGEKLYLIRYLDLSNNNLSVLNNSTFQDFENLEVLYLDYNHIDIGNNDPFDSIALTLQNLSLSHNNLKGEIEQHIFSYIDHLKFLNLSYNKIESIKYESFPASLKVFDISFNNIVHLSFESDLYFFNLEYLDMRGLNNDFQHLFPFTHMENLSILKFGGKQMETLDDIVLLGLCCLRVLVITNTSVYLLPNRLLQFLHELAEIDLSNNQLSDLNNTLFSFSLKIKKINLSGNQFRDVNVIITAISNLNLTHLDLGENLINEPLLADILSEQSQLQYLSLSNNHLQSINQRLLSKSLKELDLSYNMISFVKSNAFQGCTALRQVNLVGNKLSTWPMFKLSYGFVNFIINNNPWNCTCNLYNNILGDGVASNSYRTRVKCLGLNENDFSCITCQYPRKLQNRTLSKLSSELCGSPKSDVSALSIYFIVIGLLIILLLIIFACVILKRKFKCKPINSLPISTINLPSGDNNVEDRERNSSNAAIILHQQPQAQSKVISEETSSSIFQTSALLADLKDDCLKNKDHSFIDCKTQNYEEADENANSYKSKHLHNNSKRDIKIIENSTKKIINTINISLES